MSHSNAVDREKRENAKLVIRLMHFTVIVLTASYRVTDSNYT
jgi:hypothetical protein